jgi:hypothetical protein
MTHATEPGAPLEREARRDPWAILAAVACCAALPLGLLALGISVGGLASARWWLLALAAVIVCAAVVAHRTSGSRDGC